MLRTSRARRRSLLRGAVLLLTGLCLVLGLAPVAGLDVYAPLDLDDADVLLSPAVPGSALPALLLAAARPSGLLPVAVRTFKLVRPPIL